MHLPSPGLCYPGRDPESGTSYNEGYPSWCDPERDRREELQRAWDELNAKIRAHFGDIQRILEDSKQVAAGGGSGSEAQSAETPAQKDARQGRAATDYREPGKSRALPPVPAWGPEGSLGSRSRVEKPASPRARQLPPLPRARAQSSNPVRLRSLMSASSAWWENFVKFRPQMVAPKSGRSKGVPRPSRLAGAPVRSMNCPAATGPAVSEGGSVSSTAPTDKYATLSSGCGPASAGNSGGGTATTHSTSNGCPTSSTTSVGRSTPLSSDYTSYDSHDDECASQGIARREIRNISQLPITTSGPLKQHEGGTINPFGRCGRCRAEGEQQECVLPPPPWHWGYQRYVCRLCAREGGSCDNLPGCA